MDKPRAGCHIEATTLQITEKMGQQVLDDSRLKLRINILKEKLGKYFTYFHSEQ